MKRGLVLIVVSVFLMSYLVSAAITGSAVADNSMKQGSAAGVQESEQTATVQANAGEDVRIRNAIAVRNRLRAYEETGECPEKCECNGAVTKCQLENGREMTVRAGNSGNTIVQVKGENMTTRVELYQSEGKVFGVFRNNETKEVKVLPDEVRERIRERIKARLEVRNITLDEDGQYQVEAEKRARLLWMIPVRERVQTRVNAETGEIIRTRTSWWGFLARDVPEEDSSATADDTEDEPLLGESCGTVTPGENDACCINKGYDFWNAESQECEYTSATADDTEETSEE